jgi:NAD(P)-dependent dehydrogenase (short-subunit alcohol dehydrogenase family)
LATRRVRLERYEAKRAVIIGGTSGVGLAYGGAKPAVRSFARVFAAELLPRGIRVNAVSPGPIDTPIIGKAFPDEDVAAQLTGQMREANPMKRFGTSEEIAKAVLLLLAFDATYTTGAERPVDGGLSQL